MKKKFLLVLAAGHVIVDMNQGALPAILPFLVAAGGLKYAQAAGLTFAIAMSASMLQPVFGILADKLSKSWLMPVGVLIGGFSLSLIGFFSNHYWLMFAAAIGSGLGVAAFHPEGASLANKLSGKKKGGGMSIFSVGGSIGFSIGPLLVTPAMIYFGLRGSIVLAIPTLIMVIILIKTIPTIRSLCKMPEEGAAAIQGDRKNEWGKFLWLSLAIISRSVISHGINTFLPLYWINVLHQSKATGGMALSFMFCFGIVATIIGGHMADRIGVNNIIKIAWIILIPSVFSLTIITHYIGAWLILIPISFGINLLSTPQVLLGQKFLPANIGFASGITMGLGVSIGGLAVPFLGSYADLNGLSAALKLLCILPFAGALVALTLKPPKHA